MTTIKFARLAAICALTLSISSASLAVTSQAVAATQAVPSAATTSTQSDSPIANLAASYAGLQDIWNHCYKLKNISDDLLAEGKNSPARKQWVDYYVSTAKQSIDSLTKQSADTQFPPDLQDSLKGQWSEVSDSITSADGAVKELQGEAQRLKAPADGQYPPIFWGSAKNLRNAADKLDKSLIAVIAVLDSSRDNALLTAAQQNGISEEWLNESAGLSGSNEPGANTDSSSANTPTSMQSGSILKGSASASSTEKGLAHVSTACQHVRKSCFQMFGELERFNLLYAHPPAGEPANMFYGGAFTKQEVLSQYKYMPNLVFTSAPYVKLFSYPLPPRQAMLATYTDQIGTLLNLMESDIKGIEVPNDKKDAVAAPLKAMDQQFVDARKQYMNLFSLVQNSSDKRLEKNLREDQVSLGAPVMAIYQDMDKMRIALNDVQSIIKGR